MSLSSTLVPNAETMRDWGTCLAGLSLADDHAIALAHHVARLNAAVHAVAVRLDDSDEPALFGQLLSSLKQPTGT